MKLEALNMDLFVRIELNDAASVLGGLAVPPEGYTFADCYTFTYDGWVNDKDQD